MEDQRQSEIITAESPGKALFYRWIIWVVMVFAFMVSFFHRFAATVVREDVVRDYALSATAFGAMASMYFYAYMAAQIPVGILVDSLGPRMTISLGMFLAGGASILFAFAPSSLWLFVARFLVGVGVAAVFISIMKVQSQWFRNREFATVSGAATLVGNVGGILSQGPLALLISVISWRTGFSAIGAFTLFLALLCFIIIRNKPQDMGFPPMNEREIARSALPAERFSIAAGLKGVLFVKGMAPTSFFYFCNQGGLFALTGAWSIPWLTEVYGVSIKEASAYSVYLVLGIMFGGIITGWISDRIGSRKIPMVAGSLIHTALWALLIAGTGAPPIHWVKVIFLALGLTNTVFVLAWSVAREITSEKYTGLAIAAINTAGFLSIALTTSAIGWTLDISSALPPAGAFQRAFILPLVLSGLSFLSALCVPETGFRRKK